MKSIIALFTQPSAAALAKKELDDAQRGLLQAQSTAEYANSMVNYHTARIRRLSKYQDQTETKENYVVTNMARA